MDIRITDHDDIWIDGKQYVSLEKANRLAQEAGAIDYDKIKTIVAEAVKTSDITEEQVRAFCEARNWTIYDKALLDDRLESQYRLGYTAGSKDANARFNILDVQRQKDLEELRAAHANLKIEFVKRLYEGLDAWAKGHKIGYTADDFVLVKIGIGAAEEVIRSQLTLNEYRRVFDLPEVPSNEGGAVD